jgi:type IV pilus assembly protein PilQ
VSYNNYIVLTVEVRDDKPVGALSKTTKSIKTDLMVKSGDTIVIGGIYNQDDLQAESGIPGLRRIPLLGWLFKAQSFSTKKTELLIFLTPTVVASSFKS